MGARLPRPLPKSAYVFKFENNYATVSNFDFDF